MNENEPRAVKRAVLKEALACCVFEMEVRLERKGRLSTFDKHSFIVALDRARAALGLPPKSRESVTK
jgi:hypothetical protein